MTPGVATLLGIFAVTVVLDMPIAFGLALASVAYLLIFETAPLMVAAQQLVAGLDSFTLLAIPLFLLAAQLMNAAGLTMRIVRLCSAAVGDIKGGLAVVAVLASMLFGALSGSGVADVVAIGSVILPAMYRSGYGKGFSCALLGCAGSLGTVIPPSIVMIVYGTTTNTSVGKLFIAGIVPGLQTGETSASILLIVGSAALFAWILVSEQVPQALAQALTQWTSSGTAVLLLITVVLLLLGTFMETIAIIIIVAPVVMPAIQHYGIDPVHFGILLTINLAIGANTPPLGVDLMAACRIGGITMMQALAPLAWMLAAMMLVLMLVTFVPELALFLPRQMQ